MFNILVDFSLKKKIVIDKLGLTFRKLKKREKDKLVDDVYDLYSIILNNKKEIERLLNLYENDKDLGFIAELLKFDDKTRKMIMFAFQLYKKGFVLNKKSRIKAVIEHIVVIEYDNEKFDKFVDRGKGVVFISDLLKLYYVYNDAISFNLGKANDYSVVLEDNILDTKNEAYELNIITSVMVAYDIEKRVLYKKIDLSEEYLLKLKEFTIKLKAEDIRKFVMVINMMFANSDIVQSRIINYTTIVESILIKESQNIQQNFVLKAGIILKNYLKKSNNSGIEELLGYSYDIRSSIVHGNEEKVISLMNTVKQKNKKDEKFIKLFSTSEHYFDNKRIALGGAEAMLLLTSRAVIKYWIDNPSMVDYMKNN